MIQKRKNGSTRISSYEAQCNLSLVLYAVYKVECHP